MLSFTIIAEKKKIFRSTRNVKSLNSDKQINTYEQKNGSTSSSSSSSFWMAPHPYHHEWIPIKHKKILRNLDKTFIHEYKREKLLEKSEKNVWDYNILCGHLKMVFWV